MREAAMTEDELRAIEARTKDARPYGRALQWIVEGCTESELHAAERGDTLAPATLPTTVLRAILKEVQDARQDIPRLAAALREAWADNARLSAEGVDKARAWDKLQAAQSRALAAEADCKRLQDEVANLDAARREAEAAAAEMREALGWQPIETLPEFKRAFVGRYSDHVWRQVEAHWYNWAPDGQTPRTNWSWGDRKDPLYGKPTHWHPLIAPPPAAIKETSNG